MKKWLLLISVLSGCLLAACGTAKTPVFEDDADRVTETPTPTQAASTPPLLSEGLPDAPETTANDAENDTLPQGYVISPLTGLPIPAEMLLRRPVAVVINNIYKALPQSGVSQADIIYEVLAEGDITRLVAIFHQFDAAKIGPVRSTRDYFVHFALDYDAIFVHHGGSGTGYKRLSDLRVERLDGMALEGVTFWRDPVRVKIKGMYEHSSYTDWERIEAAIIKEKFRTARYPDAHFGFAFNTEALPGDIAAETPDGTAAAESVQPVTTVQVPFSKNYTRRFIYDAATAQFSVYNANGPHIDENTGEILSVTNIIVQQVKMRVIPGDSEGRREVTTIGEGDGYLITGGAYVPLHWQKTADKEATRWTFADGTPLTLHPGKTWICVLQESAQVTFMNGDT